MIKLRYSKCRNLFTFNLIDFSLNFSTVHASGMQVPDRCTMSIFHTDFIIIKMDLKQHFFLRSVQNTLLQLRRSDIIERIVTFENKGLSIKSSHLLFYFIKTMQINKTTMAHYKHNSCSIFPNGGFQNDKYCKWPHDNLDYLSPAKKFGKIPEKSIT